MLLTLLLSGYIGPSVEAINFLLGMLAVSVLVGLLLLWQGVRLLRRERSIGWVVVLAGLVVPVLGFQVLASAF